MTTEQITARRLVEMFGRGVIGEEMLILFGISGSIPEQMPERKKEFQARMERRFGICWRNYFTQLPPWLVTETLPNNWPQEGF